MLWIQVIHNNKNTYVWHHINLLSLLIISVFTLINAIMQKISRKGHHLVISTQFIDKIDILRELVINWYFSNMNKNSIKKRFIPLCVNMTEMEKEMS